MLLHRSDERMPSRWSKNVGEIQAAGCLLCFVADLRLELVFRRIRGADCPSRENSDLIPNCEEKRMYEPQLRRRNWLILAAGIAIFGFAVVNTAAPAIAADKKAKEKVDLNTASENDLLELPGVGEVTAKKIIAGRPYKSIAAGLSKAGLNDAEIAKLKGLVAISEAKEETKPADKSAEKKSDKTADKAKTPDNGKTTADSKASDTAKSGDKDKSSKMDAKSGKDATDKTADKMTKSTDKSADKTKSTDKPADKTSSADKMAGPKIDLNTASQKELEQLPEIGPATATKIIAGRPYKSVEDLSHAGVTDKQIAKIKSLVMVSEVKPPAKADTKMAETDTKSAKKADKMDAATDKKAEKKADKKSADSKVTDADKSPKKEKDKTPEPPTPAPTDKEIKDATAKKLVWANLNSKVYHESGDRWYGKTHHGKFMTEDDAKKEGYTKAHMNENSDETKGSAK
jgi:competence protein ComEA